jgi:hypothetical protein
VPLHHSSVPIMWGNVAGPVPGNRPVREVSTLRDARISGGARSCSAAASRGLWTRREDTCLGGSSLTGL